MICPHCQGRLKVVHVFSAGVIGKTARAECVPCDRIYTLVTFVVCEASERGQGARALAKRLEERNEPLSLDL